MKIYLLTEADASTGYGHFTRCLSLYEAFTEYNIIPTLVIKCDNSINKLLTNLNYKKFNWLNLTSKTLNYLNNADVTIIDSYRTSKKYCYDLSRKAKITMFIDDYNRLNYPKGIVLNSSIGASALGYKKNGQNIYLLGNKYQPLRKEFWDVKPIKIKKAIRNILISFGGSGKKNPINSILKFIIEQFPSTKKSVLISSAFQDIIELKTIKDENTFIYQNLNSKELTKLLKNIDIAILSASQSTYELACFGIPQILIGTHLNQVTNIQGWTKSKAVLFAGWYDGNILNNLLNILEEIKPYKKRKMLSDLINKNTYKDGAKNIVKYILNRYENFIFN